MARFTVDRDDTLGVDFRVRDAFAAHVGLPCPVIAFVHSRPDAAPLPLRTCAGRFLRLTRKLSEPPCSWMRPGRVDTEAPPLRGASLINDDFEVGFDARFEAAWSRVEKGGRIVMFLAVLAGLAGFLGAGPFDHARVGDLGSTRGAVDFEPIARFGTATQITLHLPPDTAGRVASVHLSKGFVEPMHVEDGVPRAALQLAEDGGLVAMVRSVRTPEHNLIRFVGKPSTLGLVPLRITVGDGPPLRFSVFVLP